MPASFPYALPAIYAEDLISASAAFQGMVGAIDKAAAEAFIDQDLSTLSPPLCVLDYPGGTIWNAFAGEQTNFSMQSGAILALFRDTIAGGLDEADALLTFTNLMGEIIEDMIQLSGTSSYLHVSAIEQLQAPARPSQKEAATIGDFYQLVLRLEYESHA